MTSLRTRFTALLLLAAGCADGGLGTAVGNPSRNLASDLDGDLAISLSTSSALAADQATLPASHLEFEGCAGESAVVPIRRILDLLRAERFVVPAGVWCRTTLVADGPLTLAGSRDGLPFEASLDLGSLTLEGRYSVEGDAVRLVLVVDDPDAVPVPGVVGVDAPPALEVEPSLSLDRDFDGMYGPDDVQVAGVPEPAGCASSPAGAGPAALTLAVLALARRRSRR